MCVCVRDSLCVVTVLCHRPTPPHADIRYMMMMAICTSVTSILRRRGAFMERACSEISTRGRRRDLQAEAHGPGHVGLPLGAEEHEHAHETTEEHPVRVQADSAGNAGSHGNKD